MAKKMVCSVCGTVGATHRQGTGSCAVEIALWFLGILALALWHWAFTVAPFAYTIYRSARGTRTVCGACGSTVRTVRL